MLTYLLSPQSAAIQSACLRLIVLFYGISLIVTYTEKIANGQMYSNGGLMSWRVLSFDRALNGRLFRPGIVSESFFGQTGTVAGHCLGIAGVLLAWVQPPRSFSFTVGVFAAVVSCVLVQLRSAYAGDGAQQMNLILGVALLLGFNPWATPLTGVICLFFIAAQAMLSYFVSGAAKLISPIWVRGDALIKIMGTTAYGSQLGFRAASLNPQLTKLVCQATVLAEVAFPFCVLGPRWMLLAALLWGVSFHLANAVLMGLNTFVWSYLATYPALYFVWTCMHRSDLHR